MNVSRPVLALLIVLASSAAFAEGDCEDNFMECKDDCLIEFGGSVRVEVKKQYDKCMRKCTKTANRCGERVTETRASGLDEGALDGTPASDEERTGSGPVKKKKAAPAVEQTDDEPAQKKEALSDAEVPKSERTTLKTDDAPAPAPAPAKKEVIEMKMTPRKKDEGDLRDDKPPAREEVREETPAPAPKKKTEEKKPDPPRRKEEDHDDLRNY